MKLRRSAATLLIAILAACAGHRLTFEVPEGFHGWVTVSFGNKQCVDGAVTIAGSVIAVDPKGLGCSRVSRYPKTAWLRYYYVAKGRRTRELKPTGWGQGGMVWGQSTEMDGSTFRFFVGTEQEFKRSTAEVRSRADVLWDPSLNERAAHVVRPDTRLWPARPSRLRGSTRFRALELARSDRADGSNRSILAWRPFPEH